MHQLNLNLRLPILPLLFLAVITLLTANLVQAHRIDIPAGEKACFFEDLHVEDQVCTRVSLDLDQELLSRGGIRLAYSDFAFLSYPCCSCSDVFGSCSDHALDWTMTLEIRNVNLKPRSNSTRQRYVTARVDDDHLSGRGGREHGYRFLRESIFSSLLLIRPSQVRFAYEVLRPVDEIHGVVGSPRADLLGSQSTRSYKTRPRRPCPASTANQREPTRSQRRKTGGIRIASATR
jgi:hypothetical protein